MGKRKHARREYQDLPIRLRTELRGNGDHASFLSVYCPRQQRSVSVYECGSCPDVEAVFVGAHEDLVRCRVARPATAEFHSTREAADHLPVSNIMTHDVICVRPEVTLETLTALLLERGFSGLPVVDEEARAIGVVSESDLVRYRSELEECSRSELDADERAELAAGTVGDIMTPIAFTVEERTPISAAASVMASRNIHRLPVVDSCGTVVGVLSTLDIVDWVAQGAPNHLTRRGRNPEPQLD